MEICYIISTSASTIKQPSLVTVRKVRRKICRTGKDNAEQDRAGQDNADRTGQCRAGHDVDVQLQLCHC